MEELCWSHDTNSVLYNIQLFSLTGVTVCLYYWLIRIDLGCILLHNLYHTRRPSWEILYDHRQWASVPACMCPAACQDRKHLWLNNKIRLSTTFLEASETYNWPWLTSTSCRFRCRTSGSPTASPTSPRLPWTKPPPSWLAGRSAMLWSHSGN